MQKQKIIGYQYDYANKCDCAEDDKCGCDYPNNMAHNFSPIYSKEKSFHKQKTPRIPLTVGMKAPNFIAPTVLVDDTMVRHFNFYKATENRNTVLFFYPEDFSFTCPSELLMLNKALNAFSQRNTKVLAISTDSIYTHLAWKQMPPESDGISDLNFPLIADLDKKITKSYGVLSLKETAKRATIIIDTQKIIRFISINDDFIYRTPYEILRVIELINHQTHELTNCPVGLKQNYPYERPKTESLTKMYSDIPQ